MNFAPCLLALAAAAWAGPSVDPNVPMWTRAEYNAAIMTRLAGLPTDARQDRLLSLIGKDPKTGEARPVEPMKDPSEREKLKAALGRDLSYLKEALDHRRNLDMSNADLDLEMVRRFNTKHNALINEYWPKSGLAAAGPPPSIETLPQIPAPASTPGQAPVPDPGSATGLETSGASGSASSGGPGKGNPNDAAANGEPDGRSGADLGRLRGSFAKALGSAKDGAAAFDKKNDDLNLAPKAAGPQERPGPQGPGTRPIQAPPEKSASATPARPPSHQTPPTGAPVATRPLAVAPPEAPPAAEAGATARPQPNPPQIPRAPAGSFDAGASGASGFARRPEAASPEAKPLALKAPPGEESLSPEELAAIKDIQSMLAAASGEAPLDTEALKKDAEKLDHAAAGAAWKGVDVRALREQINKVIQMAGVEGLSLTQQQIIFQAAANLGLSDTQAYKIIKALRLSEPPSPRLAGLDWWQRLLAWIRYYVNRLMRRLV